MKKLTNTYFKRSKKSEKDMIISRELTTGKLHYSLHKKNSYSVRSDMRANKPRRGGNHLVADLMHEQPVKESQIGRQDEDIP